MSSHQDLEQRILSVKQRIQKYYPANPSLVAVSKGQTADKIYKAWKFGLTDFAENYAQEAQKKMNSLEHCPINWHFIGHIQRNKAKWIAEHFSWVQSLDSPTIATLLSKHRPKDKPPLKVLIQVNLDEAPQKSGVFEKNLLPLIILTQSLPNLTLKGIMGIPEPKTKFTEQIASFKRFARQFKILQKTFPVFDTLSLGMSDDFEAAILAGSTMLRIGSAIFGQRYEKGTI